MNLPAQRLRYAAVGLAASLAVSCRTAPHPASVAGPNVLLITVDTLRADHLSCYGYEKPTSPFMDRLAAKGIRFENACSASSWTAPSMASIFTGLYPRQHGVRHGVVEEARIVRQEYLPDNVPTLAEVMKAAGYETFAVLSNGHTSRETGFARGFDHFRMLWFKESPEPNEAVFDWAMRLRRAKKYFLWVHYFDPHAPYTWRADWLEKHAASLTDCARWAGLQMRDLRGQIAEIRTQPAARQALMDLYDGEIRWCDRHIEELCRRLGALTNSIIIISSDHGEEFLEHGQIGHGENLFEPTIRVPLIICFPDERHASKVITAPVSNKDIMATLADLLDIPVSRPIPGDSWVPYFENEPGTSAPIYFELDRGANWKGVRRDRWKFLVQPKKNKALLFDLARDPHERDPLQHANPRMAATLRDELERWMNATPVSAPTSENGLRLNALQQEQLRSLGYLR